MAEEKKLITSYVNKILFGDACDKLSLLPDKSVDLIVTDPPYLIKNTIHIKELNHNKKPSSNELGLNVFSIIIQVQ